MKLTKLSKLTAILSLVSSLGFALSGQAMAAPDGVKLAKEQVIKINDSYPDTFDPSLLQMSNEFYLSRSLFSPLVRQNFTGQYVPETAESWTVSPDGLTYTFKIRKDAVWSDGKPVRAQDFVYSWRRLVDPALAAAYASYLPDLSVVNAQDIVEGKEKPSELGVSAPDDHTFVVNLSQPTPWLIQAISLGVLAPLREDVITKYGQNWVKPENIVTNGPFLMKKNLFKDNLVIEKSPLYWDRDHVAIEKVDFKYIDNPNASYLGFVAGDFTFSGIPATYKQKALTELKDSLIEGKSPSVFWMIVNTKHIKDEKARQALSYLIDRKSYTEKVIKQGLPTTQLTPDNIQEGQFIKGQEWENKPRAELVKMAVDLLTEAGYTKDKPFEFEYLTTNLKDNKFYIALRDWLEKDTGGLIKITPKVQESKIFYQSQRSGDYDVTSSGWGADYDQVSTFLNTFTCKSPINNTGWCNPEYDSLLAQAAKLPNAVDRANLYAQAHDIVVKANVWIPFLRSSTISLKDPRLLGFNLNNAERYIQDYYFVDKENIAEALKIENETIAKAKEAANNK